MEQSATSCNSSDFSNPLLEKQGIKILQWLSGVESDIKLSNGRQSTNGGTVDRGMFIGF